MVEEMRVFSNNVTNCLLGYNEALVQEYGEKEGDTFPTMEDFLQLHEGAEIYHLFVKEFVRKVVGEKTWKSNCYRILLSEYCSISSEAFCLLTLENNYDRWISKVKNPDNDAPETRYIPPWRLPVVEEDPQDAFRVGHKKDMTVLKEFTS